MLTVTAWQLLDAYLHWSSLRQKAQTRIFDGLPRCVVGPLEGLFLLVWQQLLVWPYQINVVAASLTA